MIGNKGKYSRISRITYLSILSVSMFVLFTLLLFIVNACQEEAEEITPTPSDKVIIPNSAISQMIQGIAILDGSPDNILDNASCMTLVLPVTVVVNGQEILIGSANDFAVVEHILDESELDDDTVMVIFPVVVNLADHTELIMNNAEELEDLADQCTEGGLDNDIECIDFKYPVTFSLYDSENQLSDVTAINNDRELYQFFDGLGDDTLVGFKFPITVILSGGEVIIDNNHDLEVVIENSMKDCDEDDDNDHNDDDADDSGLIAALLAGNWKITHFSNGSDETALFADYIITFHENRTTVATDGVSAVNGEWETNGDDGTLALELFLGGESPFDMVPAFSRVIEFNSSLIKLKNVNSEDGLETTMIFEKI